MNPARIPLLLTALFAVPWAAAAEHPEPPKPPAPEELFKTMDSNHDGVLSKDEFAQGMEALHKRMGPPPRGEDGEHRPTPPKDGDQQGGERKPPKSGDGERRPPPPRDEDGKDGAHRPPPPKEGDEKAGGGPEGGQKKGGPGKKLDAAFTSSDADKSGTLTLEEFKAALKAMRPPRREDD